MYDATEHDDARAPLRLFIATSLASLAATTQRPEGVAEVEPFNAANIDFDSDSWIDYLERVQDWLRLEQRIEPFLSTTAVLRDLFATLAKDGLAGKVETNGITLTTAGLEPLADRLDRAVALRDAFGADLEEHNLRAATERWVEAWDDAAEDRSSEPIRAKADTWPILTFVGRATRGQLDLNPTYQRGDVWPTKDAQLLIESILRGIPLPSIIVLRPESIATAPWEVVDGKQRLTSILRFIGAHPAAIQTVREMESAHPGVLSERLYREDYPAFRKAWRKATGETLTATVERKNYFPFPLSKDFGAGTELARLAGHYYGDLKGEIVLVGGGEASVEEVFEGTSDYKVPVIEYVEATPRQIHEVFNLYNKQGKHLNAEEIRNAVFHDLDIMRTLASMAGDSPKWTEVAPFLAPVTAEVFAVGRALDDLGIPSDRFKRTKILSWIASLLLTDPAASGSVRRLSTAQQINKFLDRVTHRNDPLRSQGRVRDVVALFAQAVAAHAGGNWSPEFRGKSRTSWEELPLVASLLGISLAVSVLGEGAAARVAETAHELRKRSTEDWTRPVKTQTALQWSYIATTALGILDVLGVSTSAAESAMRAAFGHSPVAALVQVRDEWLSTESDRTRGHLAGHP
ncbi:DUF262 domain-containing protein [Promicromonospora sp. NPDC023987]|uniref:DUF262 domain-containing protein n=1 Tax=Promicromonospora sp. NPDC023987 TaxID=3155360 RepID=UPI0033FA5C33